MFDDRYSDKNRGNTFEFDKILHDEEIVYSIYSCILFQNLSWSANNAKAEDFCGLSMVNASLSKETKGIF